MLKTLAFIAFFGLVLFNGAPATARGFGAHFAHTGMLRVYGYMRSNGHITRSYTRYPHRAGRVRRVRVSAPSYNTF